ncbi:hypothetical protein GIB67_006916 [Kingdonia uniflora]|uniref:Uncharacterized protein n=1 Tax=Kingdonia uniflora TaxID=39325 RepID=A0A7J7L0G5_9MAGN|nr:hypothetical protein GIB67_006916 [Kingdonia uniflora]
MRLHEEAIIILERIDKSNCHGYDPVSGTFDWPGDIRENIIANFEAKRYKTAHLQHRDLLENLFDGLSATGDFAWSSGLENELSTQQTNMFLYLMK